MTHPEEDTVPSGPEKAHGDALADAVEASSASSDGQPSDEAETGQDG